MPYVFNERETNLIGPEVETSQIQILSPEIVGDGSVKLFNKWSFEDVEVKDISLTYQPQRKRLNWY